MRPLALVLFVLSCGDSAPAIDADTADTRDADTRDADMLDTIDAASIDAAPPCAPSERLRLRVVTFNTGTSGGSATNPDGYDEDKAMFSDLYYGNGLAWTPAMDAARLWFAEAQPDLVVFQEIFHSDDCPSVPVEAQTGFVCESWSAGDPTVANIILGADYQVACNLGKPDKCAAVRRGFGTFRGCDSDLCLDGLDGGRVDGCGGGSRIGRGVIDLAAGGELTLVNVHGTSGLSTDDQACRVRQYDQIFVDLLDGSTEPAANGVRNLVMGDFNTDPWRTRFFDESAMRLNALVGIERDFHFISEVGPDAPGSYADAVDIDHVISDAFVGECWYAGLSEGHASVYGPTHFDHRPVVCDVEACN